MMIIYSHYTRNLSRKTGAYLKNIYQKLNKNGAKGISERGRLQAVAIGRAMLSIGLIWR